MKAYLVTTSTIFALILVAHILRAIMEGPHVGKDPWFLVTTLATIGMLLWSLRLLWRSRSS